jgi:protein involved in polysaccharide export with SLBB domain
VTPGPAQTDASGAPIDGQRQSVSLVGASDPIQIDLTSVARESQLDLPVRPGDTVIVPAAGMVMVAGWVQSPGAFHIVPGMTALGAVTAAGGALFSQTAEVLRTNATGRRSATVVNLSSVKSGQEVDVPVQAGDVVYVRRSAIGAVPYAAYTLFTKFGTGMYMPMP